MAGRGRGRGRGPRGPPRQDIFQESLELGRKELDLENKRIEIELRSNDQGKFVKIIEKSPGAQGSSMSRGRIIFSFETASTFRSILNEFVAEYQRLPPISEEVSESERLKTDSFSQGRRRYYVDLRQNQRGRFLKLTMLAGNKTFVAIPGEELNQFRDAFISLLDDTDDGGATGASVNPPQPSEPLPENREVRAGGKKFFFDVDRNDRGVFIRLSEVSGGGRGRRTHINIPQQCWSKMGSVFQSYANELPLSSDREESSGTDDN